MHLSNLRFHKNVLLLVTDPWAINRHWVAVSEIQASVFNCKHFRFQRWLISAPVSVNCARIFWKCAYPGHAQKRSLIFQHAQDRMATPMKGVYWVDADVELMLKILHEEGVGRCVTTSTHIGTLSVFERVVARLQTEGHNRDPGQDSLNLSMKKLPFLRQCRHMMGSHCAQTDHLASVSWRNWGSRLAVLTGAAGTPEVSDAFQAELPLHRIGKMKPYQI